MEKLLQYLNSMPRDRQEAFAASCGTSVGYLKKACYKHQEIGTALSVLIEKNSGCAVTRKDLHPHDWAAKWPEMQTAA